MYRKCLIALLVLVCWDALATNAKRSHKPHRVNDSTTIGAENTVRRNASYVEIPALRYPMNITNPEADLKTFGKLLTREEEKKEQIREKEKRKLEIQARISNLNINPNISYPGTTDAQREAIRKQTIACLERVTNKKKKGGDRGRKDNNVQSTSFDSCVLQLPSCTNISLNGTMQTALYFEIANYFKNASEAPFKKVLSIALNVNIKGKALKRKKKSQPHALHLKIFGVNGASTTDLHELKDVQFWKGRERTLKVNLMKELKDWKRSQMSKEGKVVKVRPTILVASVLDNNDMLLDPQHVFQDLQCNGQQTITFSNLNFVVPFLEIEAYATYNDMSIVGVEIIKKTHRRI